MSTHNTEGVPDLEVPGRAGRRSYTAAYKKTILEEYEAADGDGKGALRCRKGPQAPPAATSARSGLDQQTGRPTDPTQ
jgi:hypothetical protein